MGGEHWGRVIPIIPIKLHCFTHTSLLIRNYTRRTQAVHYLQINVQDLLPICRGIKMYENIKTLVYAYVFAYYKPNVSDSK